MAHILIVEDNIELAGNMKVFLEQSGYETACVRDGRDTLKHLKEREVDLILLDMILPDVTGAELCVEIRKQSDCPVIYVSCVSDTESIVKALENGGDDYLVKPVDYDQLLARIHAKLRRRGNIPGGKKNYGPEVIRFRQFTLDKNRHKVLHMEEDAMKEILLSPIEYDILVYMAANPNRLLAYAELYENVWDCASLGDVRTVMVHVSNLRKKIDLQQNGMITTVRRAGYIFSDV